MPAAHQALQTEPAGFPPATHGGLGQQLAGPTGESVVWTQDDAGKKN